MKVIEDLVKRVVNVPVGELLRDAVEANQAIVEDKNAEQMYRGEMPDGDKILPPYSNYTKELKELKNQATDRVTLKDTGDFYQGLKLNLESDSFIIDNTDPKTDKILNKYGDVLGLNEQSKQELIDDVLRPEIIDRVRNYLEV